VRGDAFLIDIMDEHGACGWRGVARMGLGSHSPVYPAA